LPRPPREIFTHRRDAVVKARQFAVFAGAELGAVAAEILVLAHLPDARTHDHAGSAVVEAHVGQVIGVALDGHAGAAEVAVGEQRDFAGSGGLGKGRQHGGGG
jgi:hypothetical protein